MISLMLSNERANTIQHAALDQAKARAPFRQGIG